MNKNKIFIPSKDLYIPNEQYFPNSFNPFSIQKSGGDYENRFIEYPKSIHWLKSLGIRLTNTRYEHYFKSMDVEKRIFTFDSHVKRMQIISTL